MSEFVFVVSFPETGPVAAFSDFNRAVDYIKSMEKDEPWFVTELIPKKEWHVGCRSCYGNISKLEIQKGS